MDKGYEAYKKAVEEKHGKLLYCSCSHTSSGMMIDSDSISMQELQINGEESILTITSKEPFQKKTVRTYKLKNIDLEEILTFISENSFWAFSKLNFVQDPDHIVYDLSRSAGFFLCYDDSSTTGESKAHFSINYEAMKQNGFEQIGAQLFKMMSELENKGELLSGKHEEKDDDTLSGDKHSGKDVCPFCGYKPVTGKYCPECGGKMEE